MICQRRGRLAVYCRLPCWNGSLGSNGRQENASFTSLRHAGDRQQRMVSLHQVCLEHQDIKTTCCQRSISGGNMQKAKGLCYVCTKQQPDIKTTNCWRSFSKDGLQSVARLSSAVSWTSKQPAVKDHSKERACRRQWACIVRASKTNIKTKFILRRGTADVKTICRWRSFSRDSKQKEWACILQASTQHGVGM